ncbi:DUF1059 domain-containing protein [Faunimonas sp. B44]|uniref:DUF1059 domain-containing protein n=1 Tax=Faunimonas sp. B44 TaxID=3461493 RepID=UPI0040442D81
MKRISCGDLVPGCNFKAQADTDQDVLHIEARHARQAHDLVVTPRFLERAKARIQEVSEEAQQARG